MAVRKQPKRTMTFDALEQREVLSTLAGGHSMIHEHRARKPKFVTVTMIGNEVASLTSLTQTAASGTQSGTITVKPKNSPVRGRFGAGNGSLNVTLTTTTPTPGQPVALATSQLFLKGGELDLTTPLMGSIASGSFSGTYTITGGTGHFASAVGGTGQLTATLDVNTQTANITFSGKVRVIK